MSEEELPLPRGVHEKHGSWYLIERNAWRKLCRVSDGRGVLFQRLAEVSGGIEGSVWHAILEYKRRGMGQLAPSTQKHYGNTALRMLHHFGHLQLAELEPTHAAQFLKWCRENNRATTGNREKAFMSSVYEFALAEGWCSSNPWRGVRRNRERPSRRYVEHETLTAEIDRAPPALQSLFAVAYLLGVRQTDLRLAKRTQIIGKVLHVTESKTGKHNEHTITATVGKFLREAMLRTPDSEFIFTSTRGLPWSEWGLQSALRRFGAAFRFRDLRAKAQTDRPDADVLGHVGQLRERYTRRRKLSAVK
jgi:Phage integrase, N-terminal SAM-like domain